MYTDFTIICSKDKKVCKQNIARKPFLKYRKEILSEDTLLVLDSDKKEFPAFAKAKMKRQRYISLASYIHTEIIFCLCERLDRQNNRADKKPSIVV